MFDDPKKELRRMEQALWEAEEEEIPQEPDWEEDSVFLPEDWEEQDADLSRHEDIPIRNYANNYGRRPGNFAPDIRRTVYDDEEDLDDRAVVPPEPEKKGVGGLFLLLLLEILGILLVILWWVRWLNGSL